MSRQHVARFQFTSLRSILNMSRIVYLNGQYLSEDQAQVSIFDRGFLMADGIYEVTAVLDGKLADFPTHSAIAVLARSAGNRQSPYG